MTTEKEYDEYMNDPRNTLQMKKAFYLHAVHHCQPGHTQKGWRGLAMYVEMFLIVAGLIWMLINIGVPYVLHFPPVSTPDRVWIETP